jgi:DeoR/GlpR family transcriptional regulator of sugar metabolism
MGKIAYRKDHLLDLLAQRDELSSQDVADMFNISLPSVRRLFAQMEQERRLIRTHGGIRMVPVKEPPEGGRYQFEEHDAEHTAEKEAIARYAVGLLKNRQSVFIEAGTTIKQLALVLGEAFRNRTLKDMVIFTNSLTNMEILQSICKVIVVGGLYRPERRDFCGFLSERMIRSLRFDLCFLGVDGINLKDGVMAMDSETVRIDELLIKNSEKTVVLAGAEKFNRNSLIPFCSIENISMIVTDWNLPPELAKNYAAANVNLVCVPKP